MHFILPFSFDVFFSTLFCLPPFSQFSNQYNLNFDSEFKCELWSTLLFILGFMNCGIVQYRQSFIAQEVKNVFLVEPSLFIPPIFNAERKAQSFSFWHVHREFVVSNIKGTLSVWQREQVFDACSLRETFGEPLIKAGTIFAFHHEFVVANFQPTFFILLLSDPILLLLLCLYTFSYSHALEKELMSFSITSHKNKQYNLNSQFHKYGFLICVN